MLRQAGLAMVGLYLLGGVAAFAQDDPAPVHPLATKQQMVLDRIARLEDRMFRLREKLADDEPENAQRLAEALQQAGALNIDQQAESIINMLQSADQLDLTLERQQELVEKLEALLDVLLERGDIDPDRARERKRLARIQQDLDAIRRAQLQLREQSADAVRAARARAQIQAAKRQVDKLIERQLRLNDKSGDANEPQAGDQKNGQDKSKEDSDGDDPSRRSQPSAEQEDIARETRSVARAVKQIERKTSPDTPGTDIPDADHPSDQPSESEQATENEQSEKPHNADGDLNKAAEALQQGSESMRGAADHINQGDQSSAEKKQQEALEKLRRARHRLEKAQEKLDTESENKNASNEQRNLAKRSRKLAQKMQGSQQGNQSSGDQGEQNQPQPGQQRGQQQQDNQQSQNKPQQPTPGQPNVQRAGKHMKRAAEKLDKKETEDAIEEQDKALAELEQAKEELEELLRQLRKEQQEEILTGLESRLAELVLNQRAINEETEALASSVSKPLIRSDRMKCSDLSTRQAELIEKVNMCVRMLEEDGTTVVFYNVMAQVSDDMAEVSDRLAEFRLDTMTMTAQENILLTLEDLSAAIRQLHEKRKQQGGGAMPGAGGGGDAPLVPTSAELRMLKSSQGRINRRTEAARRVREGDADADIDVELSLKRAARRQAELAEMARKLQERAQQR